MLTPEEQKEFDTLNKKLDDIDQKVTSEEPSWWSVWWPRIKYVLIGIAWLFGIISHKWGLYKHISSWLE